MKKVLSVFVLSLLVSTSLFAKEYKGDEVKECGDLLCDLDGNLITGIAKEFYDNGNIQLEMELKNGKPVFGYLYPGKRLMTKAHLHNLTRLKIVTVSNFDDIY